MAIEWRTEFKSDRLWPGLISGGLVGLTEVILSISFASLIFSGVYAEYLARGIGIALISTAILSLFTAFFSRIPGGASIAQDSPTLIVALMAAHMAEHFSPAHADQMLPTLLTTIALSTLTTAVFLLLVGRFKLGRLVRYIPYPVIAGFLAGIGWLLAIGGVEIMLDGSLTLDILPTMLQPELARLWVPGVLVGAILLIGLRRIKHPLALPGLLVGCLILFYVLMFVAGYNFQTALENKMLFGQVGDIGWQPLTPAIIAQTDWPVLLGEGEHIPVLIFMVVINLLLNIQGLETSLKAELDVNGEIQTAGGSNLVVTLFGGMSGYPTISMTMLNDRIGNRSRLAAIVVGLLCLLVLFIGADLIGYLPRPFVGGVLFFVGLDMLVDWGVSTARTLSRIEYVIVLSILLTVILIGFLEGVAVGLVLMMILFVVRYSRADVIRNDFTGSQRRSAVLRPTHQLDYLHEQGGLIRIYQLQGFIFFGSSHGLFEQIRESIGLARYLIIDFGLVSGIDSSAVQSLVKVQTLTEEKGIHLLITGASAGLRGQFERGDFRDVTYFDSLDYGLEWAEQHILDEAHEDIQSSERSTLRHISSMLTKVQYEILQNTYLEKLEFAPGEVLIRHGDESTDMFFIMDGRVNIQSEDTSMRLSTAGAGMLIGDLAFLLGGKRTATVVADQPTVVYRLGADHIERMRTENPELVLAFNSALNVILARRLIHADRMREGAQV